jgi:hypothetical protein
MTKKEALVISFMENCDKLVPSLYHNFKWQNTNRWVLHSLNTLFQELWDYRTGVIQSEDINDSLLSDMISLCHKIIKQETPVSQIKLAQSLLERMEK